VAIVLSSTAPVTRKQGGSNRLKLLPLVISCGDLGWAGTKELLGIAQNAPNCYNEVAIVSARQHQSRGLIARGSRCHRFPQVQHYCRRTVVIVAAVTATVCLLRRRIVCYLLELEGIQLCSSRRRRLRVSSTLIYPTISPGIDPSRAQQCTPGIPTHCYLLSDRTVENSPLPDHKRDQAKLLAQSRRM